MRATFRMGAAVHRNSLEACLQFTPRSSFRISAGTGSSTGRWDGGGRASPDRGCIQRISVFRLDEIVEAVADEIVEAVALQAARQGQGRGARATGGWRPHWQARQRPVGRNRRVGDHAGREDEAQRQRVSADRSVELGCHLGQNRQSRQPTRRLRREDRRQRPRFRGTKIRPAVCHLRGIFPWRRGSS